MIKAFIFDMDGVLIDSESLYDNAWIFAAKEFSIDKKLILEVRKKVLGLNKNDTIKKIESLLSFDEAKKFYEMTDYYADKLSIKAKPYAKEILTYLKDKKIRLCLATSNTRAFSEKVLKQNDLWNFFEDKYFVFSEDVKEAKPSPEIYLRAQEKLNLNSEECIAVEDSPNGIKSAISANLKCIFIPDRIQANEEIYKQSYKIYPNLLSLKELI